jgi:hypothetical protein
MVNSISKVSGLGKYGNRGYFILGLDGGKRSNIVIIKKKLMSFLDIGL